EEVMVSSGLDAISHALESAWNRNANPASLGLVTKSLELSLSALPRAVREPESLEARADMMQASALAGLAISQTRTALAHAISYPLTARFGLPHGLACSFTLPALLRFNAARDDGRLEALARCLGHADTAALAAGLEALLDELGLRDRLAAHLPDRRSIIALSPAMWAPGRAEYKRRQASGDGAKALVTEARDALGLSRRRRPPLQVERDAGDDRELEQNLRDAAGDLDVAGADARQHEDLVAGLGP